MRRYCITIATILVGHKKLLIDVITIRDIADSRTTLFSKKVRTCSNAITFFVRKD